MQNLRLFKIFIVICIILVAGNLYGFVDSNSIFSDSRNPASLLDLKLLDVKTDWNNRIVNSPNKLFVELYPLITKTSTAIDLKYSNDKIEIAGLIMNLNSFLTLTQDERKQLVKNFLKSIFNILFFGTRIVNTETGKLDDLEKRHITVRIDFLEQIINQKGESIRRYLPLDLGVGQAGYIDGQFIFSEDYYLNLEVIGDKSKVGDASKFVIERE